MACFSASPLYPSFFIAASHSLYRWLCQGSAEMMMLAMISNTMPTATAKLTLALLASPRYWPTVGNWVLWQDGRGPRPEGVHAMETDPDVGIDSAVGLSSRISHSAGALTELGIGVSLGLAGAAVGAARSDREIAGEAVRTLPRLGRLGRLQPHTRVSLGGLMAEQATRAPEEECFLFEDRSTPTRRFITASTTRCAASSPSVSVREPISVC
jgi:hypothetical protein